MSSPVLFALAQAVSGRRLEVSVGFCTWSGEMFESTWPGSEIFDAHTVDEFLGNERGVIALPASATLRNVVDVIAARNIGSVCVIDPKVRRRLVGMVTENSINRAYLEGDTLATNLAGASIMIPVGRMVVVPGSFPMSGALNRLLDGWRYIAVIQRVIEPDWTGVSATGVIGRRDALAFACDKLWDHDRWMDQPIGSVFERDSGRFLSFHSSTPIGEIMRAMLQRREAIGGALIVDDGKLCGIFSQRDIVTRVVYRELPLTVSVGDVMTKEVTTISPDATIREAVETMHRGNYRHLPIVDRKGKVLKLLTIRLLLKALAEQFPYQLLCVTPSNSWPSAANDNADFE